MKILLGTILLILILLGGFFFLQKEQTTTMEVLFYYPEQEEYITPFTKPVTRTLEKDEETIEVALTLLLIGPTEEEKAQGAYSPFETTVLNPEEIALINYFNYITIEGETAIVDFDTPALSYLNGPAAQQEIIKGSIERTLLQFKEIQDVQYSIEGTVFDEWDA